MLVEINYNSDTPIAGFQFNVSGVTITEASGGINLSSVRAVAESGVDLISVGALTHSAPDLDISLDIE